MQSIADIINDTPLVPPQQGEDLGGWARRLFRQGFIAGHQRGVQEYPPAQVVIVAPVPQDPVAEAHEHEPPPGRDERLRTDAQATRLFTVMNVKGFSTGPDHREANLTWMNETLGRDGAPGTAPLVTTTKDLRRWEIEALFEALDRLPDAPK